MPDTHDARGMLEAALDTMTAQVDATPAEAWTRPSPCEGWDGQALLDHVTGTLQGISAMISGGDYRAGRNRRPAEDGASAQDAIDRWHGLAEEVRRQAETMDAQEPMTGPRGEEPAWSALKVPTHDLTVHAWDLAATAGRELELPDDLLADLTDLVKNTPPDFLRSPGVFGPEVEAPHGAGPTDRLMAFLGRRHP
ncbi:TIGR03086 family metal-binding protein [Nigerium massiliense]|uniref:TIGR03086 family metal-binding protein n=1 Tax=Nigerium massiliense TaxID=1522317 RepID=UPI00058C70C4|nr:TIGR03086 family metal-binding protein [Nigerium massiliense]